MIKEFIIDNPQVTITPLIEECINNLQKENISYIKVTNGYIVFEGKVFNRQLKMRIGLHFTKSNIDFIEIFRPNEYYMNNFDINVSYEEIQNAIIELYGEPKHTEINDIETTGNGSQAIWELDSLIIEHFIIDRFGFEEHLNIYFKKT